MRIRSTIPQTPAPTGKRTIRKTVYGNTNAYIGGRFWRCIGPTGATSTEREAAEFLAGLTE